MTFFKAIVSCCKTEYKKWLKRGYIGLKETLYGSGF